MLSRHSQHANVKSKKKFSPGGVPLDIFNDILGPRFAPARSPSAPPPSSPECLLQGSQWPNVLPRWTAQRSVQRSRWPAPAECARSSGLLFSLNGKELIERKAHLRWTHYHRCVCMCACACACVCVCARACVTYASTNTTHDLPSPRRRQPTSRAVDP